MAACARRCGAGLVVALLFNLSLPAAYAAEASFFDEFGSGWENRWIHSGDSKYNGKLTVESPKSLNDPALKVRTEGLDHQGVLSGF